eukprot:g24632.t1
MFTLENGVEYVLNGLEDAEATYSQFVEILMPRRKRGLIVNGGKRYKSCIDTLMRWFMPSLAIKHGS